MATAKKPAPAPAVKAPTKPEPTKAVAVKQTTAVAVPSYIKQGSARGSENVDVADVVIPRLEIAQALSPCLKPNDPKYIEGATQGDFYNSLTNELYGPEVEVVPVYFRKEYLVWKSRDEGGGFRGAYPTLAEANARIAGEEDAEDLEPIETAQQIVLILKEDGSTEEAVVSMSRTKIKVSRQWNSLIRLNGNDRFSRVYRLTGIDETNSKNQDFKNIMVSNVGFVDADVYKKAEALYNSISSGARKVVLDNTDEQAEGAESGEY